HEWRTDAPGNARAVVLADKRDGGEDRRGSDSSPVSVAPGTPSDRGRNETVPRVVRNQSDARCGFDLGAAQHTRVLVYSIEIRHVCSQRNDQQRVVTPSLPAGICQDILGCERAWPGDLR